MNDILVENRFGHGAVKNKLDLRDRKYKNIAKASLPFDWNKGFDIEGELRKVLNIPSFKLPVKNQGQSDSCVGQAVATYESVQDAFEKGVFIERSARDPYSQIFYEDGGSTTRDALNLATNKGISREALMPSYQNGNPPSEQFMRNRSDASPATIKDALTAMGSGYATVGITIDEFAQALRDNHGMIFAINGENNGTWLSVFPKPPVDIVWGHELFVGRARIIGGKKYIGILNSWGDSVGEDGWQWIGEEYFAKKFMHSTGVIYDTALEAPKTELITLYEKLIATLQKLLNLLQGQTKLQLQ